MEAIAYAYRGGRVRVGTKVPKRAVPIANGPESSLRKAVQVLATHGWKKGVYLVPNLPLAETDDEAFKAVKDFQARLKKMLAN